MSLTRCLRILWLAAFAAAMPGLYAQQRPAAPHIGYLYPAGGRQGTTVEVTIGGQFLPGASAVRVSGTGIQASVGTYTRPLTQREIQALRDKLDEARKRLQAEGTGARGGLRNLLNLARVAREAGITEADLKALREFQESRTNPKKQLNPQIAERVVVRLEIAPDAAPGVREVRLRTPLGLSNPLRFHVGTLAEHLETEPNDRTPDNGIGSALPAVINGQITPGDVDRFTFTARRGTHLVAAAGARELIPYLADAVPGWFQATLALYDAQGREIAHADNYRFDPDPVLRCDIPADGSYTLEIRDSIYRGREDFVYRITLGEIPFITSLFPLGGRKGVSTPVEVRGWNLPTGRVTVEAGNDGTQSVCVRRGGMESNGVPFAADALPERAEQEPNDRAAQAQAVTLPLLMNGRINRPGDVDVYRIQGRAGMEVVAEVLARRLGSPLDSLLSLTDARGRPLAGSDDWEDRGAGLVTHQADSRLSLRLPADGTYFLIVRDAQHQGGEAYGYRLRLSPPQPDFALRVVPSSLGARAGATVPITVYALRRDGFTGDIALELKDAPGFRLSGGLIPAGQDSVRLTVTAPQAGGNGPVALHLEGIVQAQDREIRREAVPADDMMQAFAYRHLVPAEEWLADVAGRALLPPVVRWRQEKPIRLPAGGSARLSVILPLRLPVNQLRMVLSEPPEGITVESVAPDRNGAVVTLRADAAKVKPGLKGNLILEAYREGPAAANARPGAPARRLLLNTLPALPFEIVTP